MSLMGEQFGGHNFERAGMNTTCFICGCLEKESFNAVIFGSSSKFPYFWYSRGILFFCYGKSYRNKNFQPPFTDQSSVLAPDMCPPPLTQVKPSPWWLSFVMNCLPSGFNLTSHWLMGMKILLSPETHDHFPQPVSTLPISGNEKRFFPPESVYP